MKTYIAPEWQNALYQQNLQSFNDIWNYEENAGIEKDWVEEPNQRRGGWSGVCRVALLNPQGEKKIVYLKRQSKHVYHSLFSPFKGRLTFRREFCNIMRFRKRGLPTVTPIYYGQQGDEAILMTEDLGGYKSLDAWMLEWQEKGMPSRRIQNCIIREVGQVVNRMHRHYYKHSCLEFKHIFLSLANDEVKISIIDLEKLRCCFLLNQYRYQDLSRLLRKSAKKVKLTDKWRFVKAYGGENASKETIKSLWRNLDEFSLKKAARDLIKNRKGRGRSK